MSAVSDQTVVFFSRLTEQTPLQKEMLIVEIESARPCLTSRRIEGLRSKVQTLEVMKRSRNGQEDEKLICLEVQSCLR